MVNPPAADRANDLEVQPKEGVRVRQRPPARPTQRVQPAAIGGLKPRRKRLTRLDVPDFSTP